MKTPPGPADPMRCVEDVGVRHTPRQRMNCLPCQRALHVRTVRDFNALRQSLHVDAATSADAVSFGVDLADPEQRLAVCRAAVAIQCEKAERLRLQHRPTRLVRMLRRLATRLDRDPLAPSRNPLGL